MQQWRTSLLTQRIPNAPTSLAPFAHACPVDAFALDSPEQGSTSFIVSAGRLGGFGIAADSSVPAVLNLRREPGFGEGKVR
jgi:hypothetical protein